MTEKGKETIALDVLLKEETIGELEKAISDFQDKKIGGLGLLAEAVNAWEKVNRNETLKAIIEEKIRRMRLALHQMVGLNISKYGDPVRKRYSPHHWFDDMQEGIKEEKELAKFVLEKTQLLKEFFGSL